MKVSVEISGKEMTKRLYFHGNTAADEGVAARVREIGGVMANLYIALAHLRDDVIDRPESSARVILAEIAEIERSFGTEFTFD